MTKKERLISSGHAACGGCGGVVGMNFVLEALGPNTVFAIPACCWTIIAGAYPTSSLKIPVFHTSFASVAAAATGLKAAYDMKGKKDVNVVAWAGDGGTFDIGLQALSGAAEREENIIYICNDNEAYMNTGVQRSSSTPFGTKTTTTPKGALEMNWKKNMPEIVAAHGASYVASASLAYPKDFAAKMATAKNMGGFRYIQFCSPCPAGWGYDARYLRKIAELAVKTGIYPVYEIFDGKEYIIQRPNPKSKKGLVPVEEYLKLQGRFKNLTPENVEYIQKKVNENWRCLRERHKNV